MSFLLFLLSGRRCTSASKVYLECFAFGVCIFADNIFRTSDKGIPLNVISAIVSAIDFLVYLPNQHQTVKVIDSFAFQIQLFVLALTDIVHIALHSRDISIEFHFNRVIAYLTFECKGCLGIGCIPR